MVDVCWKKEGIPGLTMPGRPLQLSAEALSVGLTGRLLPILRDKVEWDEEQEKLAQAAVEKQMSMAVPPELQEEYNGNPASFWASFYANVKDGFFNDRAWLRTEFSDLADAVKADVSRYSPFWARSSLHSALGAPSLKLSTVLGWTQDYR